MAHRSQCSSAGDNPLDPNYLPPHYREEYRIAIDALIEAGVNGYCGFLQEADVVDFLSRSEIEYIQSNVQDPRQIAQAESRFVGEDVDGSSDTYWPVHSDIAAPALDLGWPQQHRFVGPTEVTTLVNPSDPEMPSIKEQVRRMIKNAQQVVAIVMDMFTDVDIFADILDAAMRGVAVYILLDELNSHHFVAMVNNCRVNLHEIELMRVRTVSGSKYFCCNGKSFKGQMMDRFMLVDCYAVLSGNYSFMWSFEKIHRCLAHLFLGQLVTTFDEEFRILFAHSEPLIIENVLCNLPPHSDVESYYPEKTPMFMREYPAMGMDWAERTPENQMNMGHKIIPFRSGSIHSTTEGKTSIQRPSNINVNQQFRRDQPFVGQMRGPQEMGGFMRHGHANIPDYDYMPLQNIPSMRGQHYMEGQAAQGGHFARDALAFQGAGFQPSREMYGRVRGHGYHNEQFSASCYPREKEEAEPPPVYDHVQRYLQSHPSVEEAQDAKNFLAPVQPFPKRQSSGQSYACQKSPTQPNLSDQKRFFNANCKTQDVNQKQGLRDWRISSYLSTYDDAGEMDLPDFEGSGPCENEPYFTKEAPCGPIGGENRLLGKELSNIPTYRDSLTSLPVQNCPIVQNTFVENPPDLSQMNKTPTTTSDSSCNTEPEKMEETQNTEPKETKLVKEEFQRRKPTHMVQRGSRLRHSLIFSSNVESHHSDELKGEDVKNVDDTPKPSARVSQFLDKRRTTTFQPFQWSKLVRSATTDDSTSDSANASAELNKKDASIVVESENSQTLPKMSINDPLQEKELPEISTAVEGSSERKNESLPILCHRSFVDMNDPDSRLRFFKELAAQRKAEAAKVSQNNLGESNKMCNPPDILSTNLTDKKAELFFKGPETLPKCKDTGKTSEKQDTREDTKYEESTQSIPNRATDAEKIRIKQKLAEDSVNLFQEDKSQLLNPSVKTATGSTAENQPTAIFNLKEKSLLPASVAMGGPPVNATQTCLAPLSTNPNVDSQKSVKDSQPSFLSTPKIFSDSTIDTEALNVSDPKKHSNKSLTPSQNTVLTGLESFQPQHDAEHEANTFKKTIEENPTQSNKHSTEAETFETLEKHTGNGIVDGHNISLQFSDSSSSPQHKSLTETDSSAAKNDVSHKTYLAGAEHSETKEAPKTDSSHLLGLPDTASFQNAPQKDTESHRHTPPSGVKSSHPFPSKDVVSSQSTSITETDSFQNPTLGNTDPSKETDSSQHSSIIQMDQDSSHLLPSREAVSSQSPSLLNIDSHPLPLKSAESSHYPSPIKSNFSQLPPLTDTDSSQYSPTGKVSSHQPHLTDKDSSIQPHLLETISSHPSVADSSHQPHSTGINFSQPRHPSDTKLSQQPDLSETNSSPLPETNSSLQSLFSVIDSLIQSVENISSHPPKTNSSHQAQPSGTDSSLADADSSSQPNPEDTGSPHLNLSKNKDSSVQLLPEDIGSSQQPLPTDTDSFPLAIAVKMGTPLTESQTTEKDKTANLLSASSSTNAAEANVPDAESAIATKNTELEEDSLCLKNALVDSPANIIVSSNRESNVEENIFVCEGDSLSPSASIQTVAVSPSVQELAGSQEQTDEVISDTKSFPTMPTISSSEEMSQQESSTEITKNTECNIPIPRKESPDLTPTTDPVLKDNITSQNIVTTDLKPSVEHRQSGLNSQETLIQDPANSSVISTGNDTEICASSELHSVQTHSVQPHALPGPRPSSDGIRGTSCNTSPNPDDSSCLEESKVACQSCEVSIEPQKTDPSDPCDEKENVEISVMKDKADSSNTSTPEVEHSKTDVQDSVSENHSPTAENTKPTISTLQSSTANVLSCSNLRDDTKVLLEQISAKNQSRSSQTKQTSVTPSEDEVISTDKQISGYTGRTWSAKASPEERQMLLQKMEKMRKERKVYSRFETS